jgi:hypothetical protein
MLQLSCSFQYAVLLGGWILRRTELFPDLLGVCEDYFRCQPRPTNGIFVAMIVMNWTLASKGNAAI